MRKLVFWCDKCGQEIKAGKQTLDLTGLDTEGLEWRSDTEKRNYDLCPPCWLVFKGMLKPLHGTDGAR